MRQRPIQRPAFLALATMLTVAPAMAGGIGAWADGDRASARLIAAGVGPDGLVAAGLEVVLPPGWKTYWRNPGDAGIEPVFDFSGSENVGEVSVAYPTPERYDDGYSVINIYHDRVVFPLTAPVIDAGEPLRLVAELKFGVCEIVCVADTLAVEVEIPTGATDPRAAAMLDAARAALPGEPIEGAFAVADVRRDGGSDRRPVYVFRAYTPAGARTEVFVDGPDGWYPALPELLDEDGTMTTWRVPFSRAGSNAPLEDAAFTVVLSAGDEAILQDVAPAASGR